MNEDFWRKFFSVLPCHSIPILSSCLLPVILSERSESKDLVQNAKVVPNATKRVCFPIRTAQDFSTRSINRAPENRSGARFLGRGGAALQVVRFAIRQNADSIGVRRRGRNDKDGLHFQRPIRLRGSLPVRRSAQGDKRKRPAPARPAVRGCEKLPIAPSIKEKGKTTLLPFSPYSEELHAGKVNVPHVYKRCAPKCAAQRKTPIAPPIGRTMGFS